MLHIITSNGDGLLDLSTSMTLHDREPQKDKVLIHFSRFLPATHSIRVNCTEMAGDRPRQPAQEIVSIKRRF